MVLRFVKQLLLFLTPFALVVAGVNFYGDAANLFHAGYEKALAKILLAGQHATELSEFNDRLLQIELVKQRAEPPDVAIIGSSRTLLINANHFHPSTVFNHSVFAAAWFDLKSLFHLLNTNGQLPDTLIVGIDPWTFNPGHVHAYTHTWLSYLQADSAAKHLRLKNEPRNRMSNLLSPSYFQSSLKQLPKRIEGDGMPIAVNERYNAGRTRCSDGSITYDPAFASTDSMQVAERIQLFLRGPLYGMNGYDSTDKAGFEAVEELLSKARAVDVYPIVFFAPVAPQVYQRLRNEHPLALLNEERLREWCLKHEVETRGSFNPNAYGLDSHHFFDGIHLNETGLARFFEVRKTEELPSARKLDHPSKKHQSN